MQQYHGADRAGNGDILSLVRELEAEICDLANMAWIASDFLDDNLTDNLTSCDSPDILRITITRGYFDRCSFAWGDVANRASALKERYYEALSGRAHHE